MTRSHTPWSVALALLCGGLGACGGSGSKDCSLADPGACGAELTCATVVGRAQPMCLPPVVIEGRVLELGTTTPLPNAEVAAVDINGAPVSGVALSGADGRYQLRVPATRLDELGAPRALAVMLRAAAADHAPFPLGIRPSLPVDIGAATATTEGSPWVLTSAQTDVGLAALPAAERGRPSVSGTVELVTGQPGALVVLEGSGQAYSTVADLGGAFKLFNVAPGEGYAAQAYSAGANYTAAAFAVTAGVDKTGVALNRSAAGTATLSGSVQLVAGANGAGTSVVMVVESTFNAALARGEVPPGLRAPTPGTTPNVTGAWSIAGVPDGKYVVLAAFENDGNVRDPDPNISGTQILHLTVTGGQTAANPTFKVTGAVQMVGPGAEGLEAVTGTPKFTWKPYSSAKSYAVSVFDAQGRLVWSAVATDAAKNAAGNLELSYGGPPLTAGGIFQWRAVARGNQDNPISSTEELRGIFATN